MRIDYKEILEKHHKLIAILSTFLGDLFIAFYVYLKFSDLATFRKMFGTLATYQGVDPKYLDENLVREMYQLSIHIVLTLLLFVLLFQLLMYFLYLKEKLTATGHIFLYGLIASFGLLGLAVTEIAQLNFAIALPAMIQACLFGLAAYLSSKQLKRLRKNLELKDIPHSNESTQEEK